MLNGFENITQELNTEEKACASYIASKIRFNIGKSKAVTNKRIIEVCTRAGFKKMTPARVRKIINYIRVKKIVKNLIATSKGYYVANNQKEIKDYVISLNQRINAIKQVRDSFELN